MRLNTNSKSITLLAAVGVASTSGANLRRKALFNHEPDNTQKNSNLRASSPVQQEDSSATSVVAASPSVSTDQTVYGEDEPITVFFDVGSPTDKFYSSSEAPSLDLDYTYSQWSVGIFMRDADPQGGEHDPIVSINLCGALECNADDNDYNFYNGGTVTFSSDHFDLMQGHWPPEVAEYGTGYDVYVLDANGAAAIGPYEFYIEDDYSQVNVDKAASHQVTAEKKESEPAPHESHPLYKFGKGTKASTSGQHAIVSSASAPRATVSNSKIIKASGLEMSSEAYPSSATIHAVEKQDDEPCCLAGSISAAKMQYAEDEEITFTVSIPSNAMSSNYRVGIFMRMASPQGGTLPPIVSLPLCPDNGCLTDSEGFIKKTITFGMDSRMEMQGSQWPLDLYEWGTGFDAFVLDESGNDVTAPTMFNMLMSDSY